MDRYARLYEIPFQLARQGHTVLCMSLAYQAQPSGHWRHDASPGELEWESTSISKMRPFELGCYPFRLVKRLQLFNPDVLLGTSDIPHVLVTAWVAKRLKRPYCVDLYDNFEGFGQARIPGLVPLFRRAVRDAKLVTTTSEPLAEMVRNDYRARGRVCSMPSTIDKTLFHPRDQLECRRRLHLPANAKLVGTAGSLCRSNGIGTLYEAWKIVVAQCPEVHLAVAGPLDKKLMPPRDPRIHYLGQLPHARTADLFNALDVGVMCIRDTAFGRYCFPQKAYEMLACGLPVVAADVGAMSRLFADQPQCLYAVDDAPALASKIRDQLARPVNPDIDIKDWAGVVRDLESSLTELVTGIRRASRLNV